MFSLDNSDSSANKEDRTYATVICDSEALLRQRSEVLQHVSADRRSLHRARGCRKAPSSTLASAAKVVSREIILTVPCWSGHDLSNWLTLLVLLFISSSTDYSQITCTEQLKHPVLPMTLA